MLAGVEGRPLRSDGVNRWFLFRTVVRLPVAARRARLAVTVDGRYRLFVGGQSIGRGPVRSDPHRQSFDVWDAAAHLPVGDAVIGLLVHVYGVDTAWYQTPRTVWRAVFGDGGVWVDGAAELDGGRTVPIRTGPGWQCLDCAAWDRTTPRAATGLDFIESFDARCFPDGWLDPDFDARGWDDVRVLAAGGGGPEAAFGGMEVRPFPYLVANPLPAAVEAVARPCRVIWQRRIAAAPDLPLERRSYEAALDPPEAARADGLLDGSATMLDTRHGDLALLLDFGRLMTGRVGFEVFASGGEIIEIAVAERLPGQFSHGGIAPDARIAGTGVLGTEHHLIRYVCRAGRQRFEAFEWQAVRWLQLVVRDAPSGLRLGDLQVTTTGHPARTLGAFASSEPDIDRLWRLGADTLRLCMHDAWIDGPGRERRQWAGDALVEHLAGEAAFGPQIHALNAKFLRDLAASQRPDDLVEMFAPGDHGSGALALPAWTLLWILNARDHWLWTGDRTTVEAVWPAIQRALDGFERYRPPGGLVCDMPGWPFFDWAAVDSGGESTLLNAHLAGALDAAAALGAALGDAGTAGRLRRRATEIRAVLGPRAWDPARRVYRDRADAAPAPGSVSQHANAAMLLWGGVPARRRAAVIAHISDAARLSRTRLPPIVPHGDPIDRAQGVVEANLFYAHFLHEALAAAGRIDLVLDSIDRLYAGMLRAGADTLWEAQAPTGSLCHGFSAGPTAILVTGVLGLRPAAPCFAALAFRPQLGRLEHASGRLATIRGSIEATLTRTTEGFEARLAVPDGMAVQVRAPPGYRHVELARGRHAFRSSRH